jgi:hypothetical protein
MPKTTVEIMRRLGQPETFEEMLLEAAVWGKPAPDAPAVKGDPLFPKLD